MQSFLTAGMFFFLLGSPICFGQQATVFGEIPQADKNLISYSADPEAPAVVLYEKGDNYFEVINQYIRLVKKYHVRIKVLNNKGFEEGTVAIRFYHSDGATEKVENIRAVTHNGDVRTFVMAGNIFTKDLSPTVSEKTFTFPDLKEGSVLEYEYKIISPFIYNFNGWSFQSHLPKVYSEFNATIPGNYSYNRTLTGFLKLDLNDAKLVKECFKIEGTQRGADCEVLKYVMKNIPAFKEEGYMLAASNYISRLDFELATHHRLDGVTNHYTKSWEDVDDELKDDRDLGIQLTKKGYFERNVPESLFTENDMLQRARNIYEFIRNHYTWTGNYGIYSDTRVKEAFDARKGSIGEINISLINLLNAAGIPTQMMLTSTRNHGLPKRTHPVMSDFNYLLARATINDKVYLLDASDPLIPFGMLPFRCLNYYGRVMDFKSGSYWEDIKVDEPNRYMVRAQLAFGEGMGEATGILDEITLGYEAIARRSEIKGNEADDYLEKKEAGMPGNVEITNYSLNEDISDEKKVSERFSLKLEPSLVNGTLYFNPFLVSLFEPEPFTREIRQYPIDFGHSRTYSYNISLIVPEGYVVDKLPAAVQTTLKDQVAVLKFDVSQAGNNLTLFFNLAINRPHLAPEYYAELKSLFTKVNEILKNGIIVIKKA